MYFVTHIIVNDVFFSFLQLSKAFQGNEAQGAEELVQTDPERPPLSPHQDPTHHP